MKGKLTVNCGSMFSGKSTELLRQGERHSLAGHSVLYVKPNIDTRYSKDEIVTHSGHKIKAINIKNSHELINYYKNYDVILIDEIQFFDEEIITVIDLFVKHNKIIYCSGLDMNFKGEPFNITAKLMAKSDEVNKFRAVCENCGEDANFSYKISDSKDIIDLGSKDIYIPLCRKCYYQKTKEGD